MAAFEPVVPPPLAEPAERLASLRSKIGAKYSELNAEVNCCPNRQFSWRCGLFPWLKVALVFATNTIDGPQSATLAVFLAVCCSRHLLVGAGGQGGRCREAGDSTV
eukprot:COSAG02_NODE_65_length_42645_cov_26.951934_28_plen_106_part_00